MYEFSLIKKCGILQFSIKSKSDEETNKIKLERAFLIRPAILPLGLAGSMGT